MPWWPIMMPSEAVGAPKICGTPPAARMPSHALAGQAVEVGVARRDVAEQRGDADHGPLEVVVVKADGPEHGPVGGRGPGRRWSGRLVRLRSDGMMNFRCGWTANDRGRLHHSSRHRDWRQSAAVSVAFPSNALLDS